MQISGGNIGLGDARRLQQACSHPNPDWTPGDTEPWVIEAVAALLLASGHQLVVELGGFHGACSVVLAETLRKMGGGHLVVVDYDPELTPIIYDKLAPYPDIVRTVWCDDTLDAIQRFEDRSIGFAWVDDNHDAVHVRDEVALLIPKMADGGIVCFHDVCGAYAIHHLVRHYGGVALNLPRVSHSGGLGILQVTPATREIPQMEFEFTEANRPLALHAGDLVYRVMGPDQEP